jgi:prepilin-type N-terminal cleavage/methylation domain-containing protein
MKLALPNDRLMAKGFPGSQLRVGNPRRHRAAMTLPEVLVTSAIFSLAMAGFLALQLFALRMNLAVAAKLGASDQARNAVGKMISEIRMAGIVRIGTGDESRFTEIPAGQEQRGNALQIQASKNDTNNWIRYYWDADDTRLKRTVKGDPAVSVLANSITNEMVFTSEDHKGQVLTNNFNNRVIGVNLQFSQMESAFVPTGPGQQSDFYQLRTKITRRALE